MANDTIEVDTLVIGGGMGGMTTAARLAKGGQTVMVVEVSSAIGGSAVMSEGYVWTAPDTAAFLKEDPEGDSAKFEVMVNELASALTELVEENVNVSQPLTGVLGFGHGRQIDIAAYFRRCTAAVESRGGWIMLAHRPIELVTDRSGASGAIVRNEQSGDVAEVRAAAVVLATGGFQGDASTRGRLMGPWAESLVLRSNPISVGSGLELGLAAGAALSTQMDRFYGHLIPKPLKEWKPDIFTRLTQYHSKFGLLLDPKGHRFTEEQFGDHANAQAVARIGSAVLFIDGRVWQSHATGAPVEGMPSIDRVEDARHFGAHVATAPTIEEVANAASAWGYDAAEMVQTIAAFNAGRSEPPRGDREALTASPFAMLEVQAAITFTYGGLRTDLAGRVLNQNDQPIRGLYAVGADSGGLNARGYTGGLVRGFTFGRVTARAIIEDRAE